MVRSRPFDCAIAFGGGKLTVFVDLEPDTGPPENCFIACIAFDDVQATLLNLDWLRARVLENARQHYAACGIDRAESIHDTREEDSDEYRRRCS